MGTGASLAATSKPIATWKGLIEHGLDRLLPDAIYPTRHAKLRADVGRAFQAPVDIKGILKLGDHVVSILREISAFDAWLSEVFGNLTAERTEVLAAINELRHAGALVATTNYDDLLCDEYPEMNCPNVAVRLGKTDAVCVFCFVPNMLMPRHT